METKRKHRKTKTVAEINIEIAELTALKKQQQVKEWIDDGRFNQALTGIEEAEKRRAAIKTAWIFWQEHQTQAGQEVS